MQKEYEAPKKKKYEKPKVTVAKLQIEERLMACQKMPSGGQDCKGSLAPKFS